MGHLVAAVALAVQAAHHPLDAASPLADPRRLPRAKSREAEPSSTPLKTGPAIRSTLVPPTTLHAGLPSISSLAKCNRGTGSKSRANPSPGNRRTGWRLADCLDTGERMGATLTGITQTTDNTTSKDVRQPPISNGTGEGIASSPDLGNRRPPRSALWLRLTEWQVDTAAALSVRPFQLSCVHQRKARRGVSPGHCRSSPRGLAGRPRPGLPLRQWRISLGSSKQK